MALEENAEAIMKAITSEPAQGEDRLAAIKDILKARVLGSVKVKATVVSEGRACANHSIPLLTSPQMKKREVSEIF